MAGLNGINVGEKGFNFIVETGYDATGYTLVEIKIRLGGTKVTKTGIELNADSGLSGEFYYVVEDGDFSRAGLYRCQTVVHKSASVVLYSDIATFPVSSSL